MAEKKIDIVFISEDEILVSKEFVISNPGDKVTWNVLSTDPGVRSAEIVFEQGKYFTVDGELSKKERRNLKPNKKKEKFDGRTPDISSDHAVKHKYSVIYYKTLKDEDPPEVAGRVDPIIVDDKP